MIGRKIANLLLLLWIVGLISGLAYWIMVGISREASGKPLPEITLQTIQGADYPLSNHSRKVRLLSFIYTRCPDICPTTTVKMVDLQNKLKEEKLWGSQVEFVTITLDPENDTPQALQTYAERLHIDPSGWAILRGDSVQTKEVTQSLQFYSEKLDNGLIAHSSTTYLVDQNNNIRGKYGMGNEFDSAEILDEIKKLLKEGV
jgi:protein SCO1/2